MERKSLWEHIRYTRDGDVIRLPWAISAYIFSCIFVIVFSPLFLVEHLKERGFWARLGATLKKAILFMVFASRTRGEE